MSRFLTGGRRYTMRLDGFASLNAPLAEGEFITKPFRFTGAKLEINYATSAAGQMIVEVQDEQGKPLEGFAAADCKPIWGDDVARFVEWKGGGLDGIAGQTVRLRFVMSDADLFSLRFVP